MQKTMSRTKVWRLKDKNKFSFSLRRGLSNIYEPDGLQGGSGNNLKLRLVLIAHRCERGRTYSPSSTPKIPGSRLFGKPYVKRRIAIRICLMNSPTSGVRNAKGDFL